MKSSTIATLLAALVSLLASPALRALSPPANDDFANRQSIPSGTTVSVSGTTEGATQEAFEVANAAGSAPGESLNETKTVWYDWVPPVAGTVHVTFPAFTSQGLTYLLVFKGGSVPTLSQLVTQGYLPGDPVNGDPAPPDFQVAAGQEYTLSLGNTNYPGAFTLTLTLTPDATPTPTPVPVASVTAKGSADRATGTPGKFVVSLSAAASAAVTVAYKTGGSAVAGTDYKGLPGSVTFAAGQTAATVKVKPRAAADPGAAEPTVAVKVKLQAGEGYTVGGGAEAKIKIVDGP